MIRRLTHLICTVLPAIVLYSPFPGRILADPKPSTSLDQRVEVRRCRSMSPKSLCIEKASFQQTNVGGTCQQGDEDYRMDRMCTGWS
jgi:hypothetical protein